MKRASTYALRLPTSLLEEVRHLAEANGTTVNQFIHIAVAEKTAALRTEDYFRARRERADLSVFDRILAKAGAEAPQPGDELPPRRKRSARRRAA
jgi:hypothetical protein